MREKVEIQNFVYGSFNINNLSTLITEHIQLALNGFISNRRRWNNSLQKRCCDWIRKLSINSVASILSAYLKSFYCHKEAYSKTKLIKRKVCLNNLAYYYFIFCNIERFNWQYPFINRIKETKLKEKNELLLYFFIDLRQTLKLSFKPVNSVSQTIFLQNIAKCELVVVSKTKPEWFCRKQCLGNQGFLFRLCYN